MLKKWLRWNCRIWHWGRKIGTKQVDHNNKGINQNTIERNNFSGSRYPIFGPSRFLLPYIWTFVTFGLLDICFVNTLCLTHCNHQVSLGRNVVSVRPATQCYIEWHRIPVKEQETVSLLGNLNLNLLKCEKNVILCLPIYFYFILSNQLELPPNQNLLISFFLQSLKLFHRLLWCSKLSHSLRPC